jgi:aminoglycoside 6'-N-acetyltransferase
MGISSNTSSFLQYDDQRDAPLLTKWLNTPHVYAWWGIERLPDSLGGAGDNAATVEQVKASFGSADPDTHYYIIRSDQQPIGLIQWCIVDDYEGYPESLGVRDAVGIDLLIGEFSYIGKGIGTKVIVEFTTKIALPLSGMKLAVADPESQNTVSWRAFEKAGYSCSHEFVGEGDHRTKLMVYRLGMVL